MTRIWDGICASLCAKVDSNPALCAPWRLPQGLCSPIVGSCDPNDIIGPAGFDEDKWVGGDVILPYQIRFENDPALATASAQVVGITHPLDPAVDERTFRLGEFGFGTAHL